MTEDQARDWLYVTFGAKVFSQLENFAKLLIAEAERQSLVARSTIASLWSRHLADSAQLVPLAPAHGYWVDVGSGGGLPGVVVAILRADPLIMVEPRRKRAAFLADVCDALNLRNAAVICGNVQTLEVQADILSARAVADLNAIFSWTAGVVSRETIFLLPRGQNAVSELELAQRAWQGSFHVEQSITNPTAGIVVAHGVRPL